MGDELCIKELGCFKLTQDYYHPQFRPCNVLPEPRSIIYTRFVLFTKENLHRGKFLDAENETNIKESGFDRNRTTHFIIPGYQENPLHDPWVLILMKELIAVNNSNVVIVDWSHGSRPPYVQAVANARIVGAEIARLTNALKKFGNLTTSMAHLIGHGLGAHVAGYAGQSILPRVGRITGLDPAYKFFCNMPENVRLDSDDATFVDVIHTELKSYDTGHGGCHKLGHVDFFPNYQAALPDHHYGEYTPRAAALFMSTMRNNSCRLVGYYCRSSKAFQRGECGDCGNDGSRCAPVGFPAIEYLPSRNSNFSTMYLVTGSFPHFCLYEYRIRMRLETTDSNLDRQTKSGNLLVLLRGERKPLFVQLRFYSTNQESQEYTFLVTTAVDVGRIQNVTTKWEERGVYDDQWTDGYALYHFQDSNVNLERINVTLLNFPQSENRTRPVEMEYCKASTSNDPGWMTYLPNCPE